MSNQPLKHKMRTNNEVAQSLRGQGKTYQQLATEIRQAYQGILSEEQIEKTIVWWEKFLEKHCECKPKPDAVDIDERDVNQLEFAPLDFSKVPYLPELPPLDIPATDTNVPTKLSPEVEQRFDETFFMEETLGESWIEIRLSKGNSRLAELEDFKHFLATEIERAVGEEREKNRKAIIDITKDGFDCICMSYCDDYFNSLTTKEVQS